MRKLWAKYLAPKRNAKETRNMNIKTLLLILSLMSLLVGGVLAHDADDDSHFPPRRHALEP